MKSHRLIWAVPAALVVGLSGCAVDQPFSDSSAQSHPGQSQISQTGYVERIEVVRKGAANNVAGTIIGGIVGGLIGSQIGGGRGQTAATIAGVAGGAVAGNVIEGRRRTDNEAFRVSVRLDDGSYRTLMQEDLHDLRTGDRVRVQGNEVYRI